MNINSLFGKIEFINKSSSVCIANSDSLLFFFFDINTRDSKKSDKKN